MRFTQNPQRQVLFGTHFLLKTNIQCLKADQLQTHTVALRLFRQQWT